MGKFYIDKTSGLVTNEDNPNATIVEFSEQEEEYQLLKNKSRGIESFIYANYPAKKQNQDEKWVSSYTTKLKATGVTDLETKVVGMITSFFTGKTLAVVLKDVSDEQKPYFEKLVKVGVRTEWAEKCIIEGKTAIAENREPVYPEFPTF